MKKYTKIEKAILNISTEYCANECSEYPNNCNEECILRKIERIISGEDKYDKN